MLTWPTNKVLNFIRNEVFKQQVKLVSLANFYGLYSVELFKMQKVLFNSLFFRIIAIAKLSKSISSLNYKMNNIKLTTKKKNYLYLKFLESIRHKLKNARLYKISPLNRLWIPTKNGNLKKLGISTLEDRILQNLVNLILEPLVEITSDLYNFGFRPYKSAKQALSFLRLQLKTYHNKKAFKKHASELNVLNKFYELLPENKVILDAQPKGFFNKINLDWIITNLFLDTDLVVLIKAWLNSNFIDKRIFIKTKKGTSQGSIITPTLVNFILNGLEKIIRNSFNLKRREPRLLFFKDGIKNQSSCPSVYIRYTDGFIVLAQSQRNMNNNILFSINKFLKTRGLFLSKEKTRFLKLSNKNAQLNFLGYTFKYNKNSNKKPPLFVNKNNYFNIVLYPNKEKVYDFIHKLKALFKKVQNLNGYNLIFQVNPILKGWSNYYNLTTSSYYRNVVRNAVYRLTWSWARKKHRRWGKKLIAKTYFSTEKLSSTSVFKIDRWKKVNWLFCGLIKGKFKYHEKHKSIYLNTTGVITQSLTSKHYYLPQKLQNIHRYHSDYMQKVYFNTNLKLEYTDTNTTFKKHLLTKLKNPY